MISITSMTRISCKRASSVLEKSVGGEQRIGNMLCEIPFIGEQGTFCSYLAAVTDIRHCFLVSEELFGVISRGKGTVP